MPAIFDALATPPQSARARARGALEAVSVLDAFSAQCFDGSMNLWPITPMNVSTDLDLIQPELLFVESAWSGNDRSWRYQLTSSTGPKRSILQLIEACRERGIPTVFWNKEDPPHFDDFLPLARLFDHVLTTEGAMVDRYRSEGGLSSVEVMQFAASPTIHTPERVSGFRDGAVCFAGQYFQHKYPERREQMDTLFPAAKEVGLTIYSRMLQGAPEYQFPEAFEANVRGSMPYDQMVHEYKRHKVFLNVNSVPSSQTMCARRIFELSACKTVVLSAPSPAIDATYPGGEILTAATGDEALARLTEVLDDGVLRRSLGQRAWRRTAQRHLYEDRVLQIGALLGREAARPASTLHVFADAAEEQLEALLATIAAQTISAELPVRVAALVDPRRVATGLADRLAARFGLPVTELQDDPRLADGDTMAAMAGGVEYGRDYLLDLHLLLDRFDLGDVVSKARWRDIDATDREERFDDSTEPGAWLARGQEALRLLDMERRSQQPSVLPVRSYVADPFNIARPTDAAPTGWEC